MMNSEGWPDISYFHEGTKRAKVFKESTEVIDRKNFKILCRSKSDGSYWCLDEADKYQTRFLIRIYNVDNWDSINSVPQEKQLLIDNRGGFSSSKCMWLGCEDQAIKESAFCVHHTYDMGVRE